MIYKKVPEDSVCFMARFEMTGETTYRVLELLKHAFFIHKDKCYASKVRNKDKTIICDLKDPKPYLTEDKEEATKISFDENSVAQCRISIDQGKG